MLQNGLQNEVQGFIFFDPYYNNVDTVYVRNVLFLNSKCFVFNCDEKGFFTLI